MLRLRGSAVLAAAVVCCGVTGAPADASAADTRRALIVGNNWDGTADVLDVPTYARLARINIVPDRAERLAEIMLNPVKTGALLFTRTLVGEGHDQFVDDMYASPDGRTLYVSRPSFNDAIALDLATGRIVWRRELTGARADHAALSLDGKRFVISSPNLTGPNYVNVIDTATGNLAGTWVSGDTPHENNFSVDGTRIFHASIGRVYTPGDAPALDALKGNRVFQIVDAQTLKVLKQWNMSEKLAEAGHPDMSAAVRPMALSPDEKFLYFQVSFFHGFVEFDLERERVTRLAKLPLSAATPSSREDYILDSAHHGIAMSGDGKKLCVAGTMSNYAAIVHRDDFSHRIHPLGARTYWSTTSADGKYCYVSVAGDDTLSVLSYDSEEEVARVPVGDHPQRARIANVATAVFGEPPAAGRVRPGRLSLDVRRRGRAVRLGGRLSLPASVVPGVGCRGKVVLQLRRGTRIVARASAPLRSGKGGCTYTRTLRARGAVTAQARFAGNGALLPMRSRTTRVRA